MKDPIDQTIDPVETIETVIPGEPVKQSEPDINELITNAVKLALENHLKSTNSNTTVTPQKTVVQPDVTKVNDIDTKLSEFERKLEEKYERRIFLSALNQEQLDMLNDIEGYELLPIKSLKKMVAKLGSLPGVVSTPKQAQVSDIDSIIAKLRPKQ